MLRYILLFLCLFTFSTTVTATEYKYDYQEYNNLETAFYGVSGEANIQYQVLYYLLPLDEEVLSISLNNPLYKSQHKHIDIFTGYASITDGQIMPINQDPSPLFPKTKLISYQTYFKQGIHILIIKIPYQKYNYSEQQLDILQQAPSRKVCLKKNLYKKSKEPPIKFATTIRRFL